MEQMHMSNLNTVAILLAAGQGTRSGLVHNKVIHTIGDSSILLQSYLSLKQCVQEVVVVVSRDVLNEAKEILNQYSPTMVIGGETRFESVRRGLDAIVHNRIFCDILVIHDCARCMVDCDVINDSILKASKHGSGIAGVVSSDTIKLVQYDTITTHLPRSETYQIQTPQSFRFRDIYNAYFKTIDKGYTDDSQVYSDYGITPHISQGSISNVKLTYSQDFINLNGFSLPHDFKVGHGYDVHQLTKGRKLILGGLEIPFELGLQGHSDADVLTHAIMDALLSAAGLSDIGVYFSDKDPKYKDANSIELLKTVLKMISEQGYSIINISAIIMAEAPKLADILNKIENNLATALNIQQNQIKISATTTEKLGIVGNNQGMASSAVCLLKKI